MVVWLALLSRTNAEPELTTAAAVVIVGFIARSKCIPSMILDAFARITT